MNRGDIVLVDWPYSDRTGSKVRPAVVVQENSLNQKLDDTIIALITSSRRRSAGSLTQVLVEIVTPDGQKSGLRLDSIIQCENLLTIDQKIIMRKLGDLSDELMDQVDACLKSTLDLP